jgi:hypothetical protein
LNLLRQELRDEVRAAKRSVRMEVQATHAELRTELGLPPKEDPASRGSSSMSGGSPAGVHSLQTEATPPRDASAPTTQSGANAHLDDPAEAAESARRTQQTAAGKVARTSRRATNLMARAATTRRLSHRNPLRPFASRRRWRRLVQRGTAWWRPCRWYS